MSHDACTSGTYRVLIVASLQRLKMEVLIPAPADSEVWSVIVLNAQSIAPIEMYHNKLVFGDLRFLITVLTKLAGVHFMVSLSHQGKYCVGFTLPRSMGGSPGDVSEETEEGEAKEGLENEL